MSSTEIKPYKTSISLKKIHGMLTLILVTVVTMLIFNIGMRSKSLLEENLAYNIDDVEYNLKYFAMLGSKQIGEDVWTIPTSLKITREQQPGNLLSIPVHNGYASVTTAEACHYIATNGFLASEGITGLSRVRLQNKWIACNNVQTSHGLEIPFLHGNVYLNAGPFLKDIFKNDNGEIYLNLLIILLLMLLYRSALKKSALSLLYSEKAARRYQEESSRDYLSGLLNRRGFFQYASSAMRNRPYAMFTLDIDNFKLINDTRGHDAGDIVIKSIGAFLACNNLNLRYCSRMGGEEFGGLLPVSDPTRVAELLEKIRMGIASLHIPLPDFGEHIQITVSIGAVISKSAGIGRQEVLKEADKNLYQAKTSGKNRVYLTIV